MSFRILSRRAEISMVMYLVAGVILLLGIMLFIFSLQSKNSESLGFFRALLGGG
ncbi:TPA: hypothetical protein HA251_01065 [Candidatus Woesearchaeota archaeon]|nr:hypothetical protein [Candidatus Woesearchaeota archaeon]